MVKKILSQKQISLLPFVKKFKNDFYLVGGTALALQIKHRMSIDFDLFTNRSFDNNKIVDKIKNSKIKSKQIVSNQNELALELNDVKFTFYKFPFNIPHQVKYKDIISMPTILDIAAMKAYALGKRAKWRDYVDLYFVFKHHHSYKEVTARTKIKFKGFFNEKLFREQLSFYKDVDYSQKITYFGKTVENKVIKKYLTDIAFQPIK